MDLVRERVHRVESLGTSITAMEMRSRILTMAMGLKVDKPAKYVFISGCNSPTSFTHLRHLGELLKYFDADYTFLSEEHCCGNSYLQHLEPKELKDGMADYENMSRADQAFNMQRARELGAEAVVTVCAGCNTRYNQFRVEGDPPIVYYTQFLEQYLGELKLDGQVDFYEGCHKTHRTPTFKIDVEASRRLVDGVNGLKMDVVPNFCCRKTPEKVFAAARTETIVTPTSCCVVYLNRARTADSPRVMSLTHLMCEAVGVTPRNGWAGVE